MEAELIQWLREQLTHPDALCLQDDAALLRAPHSVVTTDTLLEGTHFQRTSATWAEVGHKALAVNLSDLAAMAARPQGAVLSLALPRRQAGDIARQLIAGMLTLANRFGLALVGGDTNTWDGPLAVTVTAWGDPLYGPLRRNGGQPGDSIVVTGPLGGSLLGRHLSFMPRVAEALELARRYDLHAGMDISDGLLLDLSRMAEASGCGAELELSAVPIHPDAQRRSAQSAQSGQSPLDHALADGEDFELLLALPPREAQRLLRDESPALRDLSLAVVGRLTTEPGLAHRVNGQLTPLAVRGYQHRELT
ncbi:MAG: thiamine-phosphate kinase [Planctomycetales bacterium]|nr:thiamine-phosphate kinase [Planctomycetales bacterium]